MGRYHTAGNGIDRRQGLAAALEIPTIDAGELPPSVNYKIDALGSESSGFAKPTKPNTAIPASTSPVSSLSQKTQKRCR